MDQAGGIGQPAQNKPFVDRRQTKPDVWARIFRYLTVLVYPLLILYVLIIVELGDTFEQSSVAKQIHLSSPATTRQIGLNALLPIMIAGVVIGAIGLVLSFKRARRRSDYNYQTQMFLTIVSAGGLVIYFLLR